MFKKDAVTNLLLYSMGADEVMFSNKVQDDFLTELQGNELVQGIRKLCKVRSAIMLKGWVVNTAKGYPLQEKICTAEMYFETIDILRSDIGYVQKHDFTNQSLYAILNAIDKRLKQLLPDFLTSFTELFEHKSVISKFIVSPKQTRFMDLLNEFTLIKSMSVSIPWGVYTPMWYRLYQDNPKSYQTILTADVVFLPKLYYSCGKNYNKEKALPVIRDDYTKALKEFLEITNDSRIVSVVIDGDNVQPLQMMVVMKFLSQLRNVKSIKVAYSEDTLIRWENIHIDKVSYYKSNKYYKEKNNTDLLVGALLVEQKYKGSSTLVLISSDGDYINVIDLIQDAEIVVIKSNTTSRAYIADLEAMGVTAIELGEMFTDEQIKNMVSQDKRMQAVFALPA